MNCTTSDIVISGFSGRFPESSNVEELKQNLFEGVDMVTEDDRRWPPGTMGLSGRNGKLKDLDLFDASFFGIHAKQADKMDPQLRILLEVTHEAIIDAGINPAELRGSNTGVFIGVGVPESEDLLTSDPDKISGYEALGCHLSMFANRISYSFDFDGPSCVVDTACSSTFYALHHAVLAMRAGECDSAIVGGVTLNLKPNTSLSYHRLNMLSPDGMCKTFDANGNGYVRAEAVAVLLLQRYSDAKRIYASIVNTKVNVDGYKSQGIAFPSSEKIFKLLKQVYEEVSIDPREVSYVEAHGTGTPVGDPQETNAIAEFFCKDRSSPLLIGSIKSNMGHSEAASGICSIAKVIISMVNQALPGNLHFKKPNSNIPALLEGKLKVVDTKTTWEGGLVGLNSFGIGGANAHVILRKFSRTKTQKLHSELPKIIGVSGRTREGCQLMLDSVDKHKQDGKFIALVHNINKQQIRGYNYRGFTILSDELVKEIDVFESADKRPVWYIFTGMGTQWPKCGSELMSIPVFAESIYRSAEYVQQFGLDLVYLINNSEEKDFEDVIKTFVIVTSIQVALVDLLSSLGIYPDGIIGLSVGEVACAYADGSLTQEQTILSSYWRGKCLQESNIIDGEMVAVGLSKEEIQKICPRDIDLAVHTAADSVTIAGPKESVRKFSEKLAAQGIFTKILNSSNIPFHSRYITAAGEKLKLSMDKIIPYPKQRSPKWLSSSVQEAYWGTELDKYCNSDYFVNNHLRPVYFYETLKYIPADAITIDIAPQNLLRTVLRKSLNLTNLNLALHCKLHSNNVIFLLSNLGKLFNAGIDVDFSKLYPPIQFPVDIETPMLNSLVRWDHAHKWAVPHFTQNIQNSEQNMVIVNLAKEPFKFLTGHRIAGKLLFPATGYLFLVWKLFAKIHGSQFERFPVVFENVNLLRGTILPKEGSVKLLINILNGTGDFNICEANSLVVSGRVFVPRSHVKYQLVLPEPQDCAYGLLNLTAEDMYKELRLRGFEYSGDFQGLLSSNNIFSKGELLWKDNWISFMDTLLQLNVIAKHETKDTYVPTRIQYLSIDPQKHLTMKNGSNIYKVKYNSDSKVVQSGGIEFRHIKFTPLQDTKRQETQNAPKLENYCFIPYDNSTHLSSDPNECKFQALSILFQIIKENLQVLKVRGVEVYSNINSLMAPTLVEICLNEPLITYEFGVATTSLIDNIDRAYLLFLQQFDIKTIVKDIRVSPVDQDLHFIIAENVLSSKNTTVLFNLINSIKQEGFILLSESEEFDPAYLDKFGLIIVSKQIFHGKSFILLNRKQEIKKSQVIKITEKNLFWLEDLKSALKESKQTGTKILLVSHGEPELGIVGLMTCIRQESEAGNNVAYFFIQDKNVPDFSLENSFYTTQLEKQLMSNAFKNNKWGSYRHLWLKNYELSMKVETKHAYVNTLTRGDLSSLQWIEGPLKYEKPDKNSGKELCEVCYAPLNFRDIMLATGKLPPDALPGKIVEEECILGLEFAGRDSRGQKVMGMLPARGLATTVMADKTGFLWYVPDEWSLRDAATIPVCYSTSYYALVIRGNLKSGESVLIHAGSGGVGLASISIALFTGCKVFTTVGSKEKREFLKKTFPQLEDNCIGNSRDTSFEQMIEQETNGVGVDIVLNSLAEDKLKASVRCLKKGGRFLEIGKFDLSNDSPLGMSVFLKNTSFHGILVDALLDDNYIAERQQVKQLVLEGISNGAVKPLPSTLFSENELEQAFRFMASGKHIGKVLIEVRNEEAIQHSSTLSKKKLAVSRTYFYPDKIYIIVGGLGGFGMELAHWMISRGVKFLIITSRAGVRTGYQSMWIRRWKKSGISIFISTKDVSNIVDCEELIAEAIKTAPVGGIFNLAGVLHSDLLENLTEQHFTIVMRPKIDATKYLDIVSRRLCPLLDHFVIFSSMACGRGMPGQTNYGFANSSMERLVEKRREDGLPGLGIQWGAIGDVGMVVDIKGTNETIIGGTMPQSIYSCLNVIDIFLQKSDCFSTIVSSFVVENKIRFMKDEEDRKVSIVDVIGNIFGIKNINTINQNHKFFDLGFDSLVAIEIKQILERTYDIVMPVTEIGNLTFGKLKEIEYSRKKSSINISQKGGFDEFSEYEQQLITLNLVETELVPKKVVVPLNSENNCCGDPIFFIHVPNMKKMAMKINRPAYGLQCTKDIPFNTIGELARYYVDSMKKIQPTGPYTIIAFRFGAVIALEIGSILEAAKEKAVLKLINSSIDFISDRIISTLKYFNKPAQTPDDWKRMCISYFSMRLNPKINFLEVFDALSELKTEEEMLDKLVEYIGTSLFSSEDIKTAALLDLKKLSAVKKYEFTGKISASILLIKAIRNLKFDSKDYGLSKICDGEIEIKEIDENTRNLSVVSSENIDKLIQLLNI